MKNKFNVLDQPEDDVPIEETWQAMEQCVKLGYAKSIGISNFNSIQVDRVLQVAEIKPVVNQVIHLYLINLNIWKSDYSMS